MLSTETQTTSKDEIKELLKPVLYQSVYFELYNFLDIIEELAIYPIVSYSEPILTDIFQLRWEVNNKKIFEISYHHGTVIVQSFIDNGYLGLTRFDLDGKAIGNHFNKATIGILYKKKISIPRGMSGFIILLGLLNRGYSRKTLSERCSRVNWEEYDRWLDDHRKDFMTILTELKEIQ